MHLFQLVNRIRKTLMHHITKNIGAACMVIPDPGEKIEIRKILICRPNHRLGNQLLMTAILQEVSATFPNCTIDLFVKGTLSPLIFAHYKNVHNIICLPKKPHQHILLYIQGWMALRKTQYDLAINVVKGSSSGRLSTRWACATYKFFGDEIEDIKTKYADHEHVAKYPVYNLRNYLALLGFSNTIQTVPSLDIKLSASEIAQGKKILDGMVNFKKKTICLFTYATGAKCYTSEWWTQFYEQLKLTFAHYHFIEVLPVENISQLSFRVPSFYSKDVREIASVIANTELFIGADSGIMHLSSAAHTPTVGLFCVTNPNIFQPYGNHSVGIDTNRGQPADWMKTIKAVLQQAAAGKEHHAMQEALAHI